MALNLISLTHLGNSWNYSNTPILLERRNPTPCEWDFFLQSHFFLFFKSLYLFVMQIDMVFKLFAILQMYEFSSKSQPDAGIVITPVSCLRYCKCTSFQANHNSVAKAIVTETAVCDTANVRVFKQITTCHNYFVFIMCCLRYCKCTSFQANHNDILVTHHNKIAVCDTANVRVFKQITTSVESAKK